MSTVSKLLGGAALISLLTTVVLGLGLPPSTEQGVYARFLAVHPQVALASYLAFGVTALAGTLYLWPRTRSIKWDHLAGASAEVGVLFTALTLVTGSIWGRRTWGVWWAWDARMTFTALLLFLYLGYLALRRVPTDPDTRARRSAVAGLLAVLVVPIDHYAVVWWRTLHQTQSLDLLTRKDTLDPSYAAVMILGFADMTLVYAWLTLERYHLERRQDESVDVQLEAALAARRAEAGAEAGVPA